MGGGVVGFACAFFLSKLGLSVTVIEAGRIGEGCSYASGGWLCPAQAGPLPGPGISWYGLRSLVDRQSALYMAPRQIARMAPWFYRFWRKCNASDFRNGFVALAALSRDTFTLLDQLVADGVRVEVLGRGMATVGSDINAVAASLAELAPLRNAGYEIPDRLITGEELHDRVGGLARTIRAGFIIREHAWVKSDQYVAALAAACVARGVVVREHLSATGVVTNGARLRAVQTALGPVEADAVVIAAGAWSKELGRSLDTAIPIEAGKGYSFSVTLPELPRYALEVIDAHVGCTPIGGRLRIGGTMEFSGLNRDIDRRRVDTVIAASRRAFPGMSAEIRDVWSGPRPVTPDGLPVLDRLPRYANAFVAAGHGMMGVSLAASSGNAIAQFVATGRRPPVLEPFRATRF